MKTAEEWVNWTGVERRVGIDDVEHTLVSASDIKQIQLDAMREGMRRAAGVVNTTADELFAIVHGAQGEDESIRKILNECAEWYQARQAILSAAEQLTEKDLSV